MLSYDHIPCERFLNLSRVLDDWCAKIGRNPAGIERSILLETPEQFAQPDRYVENGITHLIVGADSPANRLDALEKLIRWRDRHQG